MWNDRLRLAGPVESDWQQLSPAQQSTARTVLEALDEDPLLGSPLFDPLKGYWSYLGRGLRIIYRIAPEARFILVLKIQAAEEST